MTAFGWDGRVVLVTGSTSGIGAETARRFAGAGARVVVNSARSVETGQELAASLPGGVYLQADVGQPEQAASLVERAVGTCGRLDCVVNNAGTSRKIPHADLAAVTREDWASVLDLNLLATWEVSRAAAQPLAQSGDGVIINVTSLAGVVVGGSSIPYAVSKAATNHLTVLLARVLAPSVRVNAVAPGMTDTPWTRDWQTERENVAKGSPRGRIGTAPEVADAVFSMASLTHVTGEVLMVDGGTHL